MKVYLVYGTYTRYYHNFDTYGDFEIEDAKIYGIYTTKEKAMEIAEDIDRNVMKIELDTFLNDCREEGCMESYCDKCLSDDTACEKCGKRYTIVNDSGYTINND